jgi:hypothetical protein
MYKEIYQYPFSSILIFQKLPGALPLRAQKSHTNTVVLKGHVPEREPLDPTSYAQASGVEDSAT